MSFVFPTALLIEDNPADAGLIKELLSSEEYGLEWVDRLSLGLDRLLLPGIGVVLLDLALPDNLGLEGLDKILTREPGMPVVILTGLQEETLGLEAIQRGAQDFLCKETFSGPLLTRALRYAVDRKRIENELRLLNKSLEQRVLERTAELEKANRRLEELVHYDGLTGIYNRRALDERLALEVVRANRHGRPLSFHLIDLDHFKELNDTLGHLAGDHVLQGIAHLLHQLARETDMVARYGGEEFAVILPETDGPGAIVLAERMRSEIEKMRWSEKSVTASFGVATAVSKDVNKLIDSADKALYHAKRKGRNQVVHCADILD